MNDVPMSLRVARASGVTIVNLCDRYLKDAPSSPSGPPYCVIMSRAMAGSDLFILTGHSNFF